MVLPSYLQLVCQSFQCHAVKRSAVQSVDLFDPTTGDCDLTPQVAIPTRFYNGKARLSPILD